MTLLAYNKTIRVRKDQCGNTPPVATFSYLPASPLQWGQSEHIGADVSDAEDSQFPPQRLHWSYDGQPLPKFPSGRGASLTTLPPGTHRITFTVTDSGGLPATIGTDVSVHNQAPDSPVIHQPEAGGTLRAGCPAQFVGIAYDREDGYLSDGLTWHSSRDGTIGTGTALAAVLDTPGSHLLRLTAADSLGATRTTQRVLGVLPAGAGCPPTARITRPDRGQTLRQMIISSEPITFSGIASDSEDPPHTLGLRWEIERVGSGQPPEVVNGVTTFERNNLISAGGQSQEYRIRFRVTDSDGMWDQDQVSVFVFSTPVL